MATVASSRAPPIGAPDTSATHPYTCNSCQVAFRNSELQRGHMRSDWHRYNLKRRVTSLPPITSEVFTEKVLQAQASSTAAATKASYERTCGACEKTYFSENAYDNHLGSAKHRSRVNALRNAGQYGDTEAASVISTAMDQESQTTGIDSDAETDIQQVVKGLNKTTIKEQAGASSSSPRPQDNNNEETKDDEEEEDEEEEGGISLSKCLFCNYDSPSIPLNVAHMERIHGMFIPERNYLVDLDGLLGALYEKIYEFHECLYCQKLKPTVFGLQTHMRDKGHCKIPFDTEEQQLDIGEFYDFRSTYSDEEDDDDDEEEDSEDEGPARSGGAKLGAARPKASDDEEMPDADGWETDSSESSLDSADLTAVPMDSHQHQYEKLDRHPHHSSQDPRPHRNKDGFHSHAHKHAHAVFYSDYELHLPSGRAVGHRSLNKYFKQNLVNHPSPAEQQERQAIQAARGSDESDEEEVDSRVARRNERERIRALTSRANGGLGMMGVSDQKKKEVSVAEKRSRKAAERERRRYEWGNNKQANSQKHFRDPLLQ